MAHGRTTTAKTTGRTAAVAEKQAYALRLRRDGASYEDIAKLVGYSDRASAYNAIRSALAEITREPAAEVKTLELARLDKLYAEAMAIVDAPTTVVARLDAIRTALKVSERRSRLEGLDAPVKTQEVRPETMSDAELLAEIEKERAAVAARLQAK